MLETLLQMTALPNLHPAIVHFPIAALPLALGFEIAGLLWIRQRWLAHAATTLLGCAALSAWLAVWAGERAADGLTGVPARVQPAIGDHSDWGHYALYCLAALALLRVVLHWMAKTTDHRGAQALSVVLGCAAVGVLVVTADLGGRLVYEHGLGVKARPAEAADGFDAGPVVPTVTSDPSSEVSARDRLTEEPDGSLVWHPAPSDRNALGEVLTAVPSSSGSVVTWSEGGEGGLTLRVDGSTTLVLPGSFSDVQVEARLVLVDWQGAVGMAHHVEREGGETHALGAFVLSSEGSATLFDVRQGERKDLDAGQVDLTGEPLHVAVSSAGRHLKGLLDGEVVTHGHIAAGPAGACGLTFDGSGLVRIEEVRVIPLDG